jgi:hypothetical protein
MRLLFHTLRSLSAAGQRLIESPEPPPTASDIRRNGNRLNTVNFVPRPSARVSGRRPYWATAKMQTRLSALRRAS